MRKKGADDACKQDDSSAGALAAGSMAKFFTEQNWEIVSFFPNAPCLPKMRGLMAQKIKPGKPQDPHKENAVNTHKKP